MSQPESAALSGAHITMPDLAERLDATLSALRRRAAAEAITELQRWEPSYSCDDDGFDDECGIVTWSEAARDLTTWVRDESILHVQGGRFEHAIALIERYRDQPFSDFKCERQPATPPTERVPK